MNNTPNNTVLKNIKAQKQHFQPDSKQTIEMQQIDNDEQQDHVQEQNQFQTLHSNQVSQPLNNNQQKPNQKYTCKRFSIYCLVFVIVIILILNNISRLYSFSNSHIQTHNIFNQSLTQPQKIVKRQGIQSQKSRNQSLINNIVEQKYIRQVIPMGKSHRQATQIKITIIQKTEIQNNYCSIVNSLTHFATNFTITLKNLLNTSKMSKIIIYSDRQSQSIAKILHQQFHQTQQLIITQDYVQIDSDYGFINKYVHNCANVAYIQTSFTVTKQQSYHIKQIMNRNPSMTVSYTGFCAVVKQQLQNKPKKPKKSRKLKLKALENINLQQITPEILANYLIIFDSRLVNILTPLNFAYYTQYSFEQLLIYPLLALTQNSATIHPINQTIHTCRKGYKNIKQLKLSNQLQYENKSLCFVSYPTNPYQINYNQLRMYLQGLWKMVKNNISISVIVYLPYTFHTGQQRIDYNYVSKLLQLKFSNPQMRIKLRIIANRSLSSFAVYESAYLYCPLKSIMISTRHNVIFKQNFAVQLINNIQQQYHYYQVNYQDHTGNVVSLGQVPLYEKPYYFRSNQTIFRSFFKHVQIYKSDLMRMMLFWVLKSAQLQFYQTQSCFVTYMMECLRLRIQYINKTLLYVSQRPQTQTQSIQIQTLTKYVQYSPIPDNIVRPYKYNCLDNEAYRRFAPERIPRSVHQIWIGNIQISPIRTKLHDTIKLHNPSYNINLWRDNNITRQNFPYTFQLVIRTLQYQKTSQRSYNALVADLLRYQILYQHGGIYIDFKMEVLKPLDAFLKYQIFFIDAGVDNTRFNVPLAVGIGIMGSMKNSYYLQTTLRYLLQNERINYQNQQIPLMTGGNVIRKAFSDQQLFNVIGLGYQLFIPKPSAVEVSQCLKLTSFSFDQQVFEIMDSFTRTSYKVGIPCKEYPQSYIISYKPLARTWKGAKRNIN